MGTYFEPNNLLYGAFMKQFCLMILCAGLALRSFAAQSSLNLENLDTRVVTVDSEQACVKMFGPNGDYITKCTPLPENLEVTFLSQSNEFAFALLKDGKIKSIGYNQNGQLGDGSDDIQQTTWVAVALPEGKVVKQLAVGISHACALTTDHEAWCWGKRPNSATTDLQTPTLVLENVATIQIVYGYYTEFTTLTGQTISNL